MKNFFLFILLLASIQVFGQKKGKEDPKDLVIDSLTKSTVMLTSQLDSTSKSSATLATQLDSMTKDRELYYGVYTAVKEKVVKKDFDPAKMSQIIDSLRATRDASFTELTSASTALSDSISVLNKENTALKASIAKMEAAAMDKEKLIAELKQLKELLDSGIITQEEYDAKKTKLMEKW